MDYSLWPSWGIAGAAVVITAAAAVTDFRYRRIPNWLTLSAFVLGLLFRLATGGGAGLLDAGLGFAVGFGTLFVLWVCGGGGAGDVKLMGALGVWLGFSLTLSVLVLSVVVVCLLSLAAPLFSRQSTVVASTTRPGDRDADNDHDADGDVPNSAAEAEGRAAQTQPKSSPDGTSDETATPDSQPARKQRLTVAFAIPLALATWIVLMLDAAGIPFRLP